MPRAFYFAILKNVDDFVLIIDPIVFDPNSQGENLSQILIAMQKNPSLTYTHESWRPGRYIQFDPKKQYVRILNASGKEPAIQYGKPGRNGPYHINDCLDIGMQPPTGWHPYKKPKSIWQRIFPWAKK